MPTNGSLQKLAVFGCLLCVAICAVAASSLAGTGHEVPLWLIVLGANAGAALVAVATRPK